MGISGMIHPNRACTTDTGEPVDAGDRTLSSTWVFGFVACRHVYLYLYYVRHKVAGPLYHACFVGRSATSGQPVLTSVPPLVLRMVLIGRPAGSRLQEFHARPQNVQSESMQVSMNLDMGQALQGQGRLLPPITRESQIQCNAEVWPFPLAVFILACNIHKDTRNKQMASLMYMWRMLKPFPICRFRRE